MRILRTGAILAGLVGTGLSVGCLTTPKSAVETVQSQSPLEHFDASKELELPTREKAKASLATAQMLDKNNKYNEAAQLYEQARNLSGEYKFVCRRLAVIYDRMGNFPKANEEYDKAIALYPKDADLLNDAGYSRYCQGNWTLAKDYLEHSIELKKDSKKAWTNLGMTLAQLDRIDQALEAFSHAISEPEAHFNLAFVYTTQGKRAEAIAEYKLVLQMAPDMDRARQAIAKLEAPEPKRTGPGVVQAGHQAARNPVDEFATGREQK